MNDFLTLIGAILVGLNVGVAAGSASKSFLVGWNTGTGAALALIMLLRFLK